MNTPNKPSPPLSKSEAVVPLSMKLALLGGGILVIVMLVFTARSFISVFYPNSVPSEALQTNTEAFAAYPNPPEENPPPAAPDNPEPETSPATRPVPFDVQIEITEQRQKARTETIEALKREAQERAGTSGVPKEALQKLEHSDPILY